MRATNLIKIRPQVPTIIEENAISTYELFQNKTLRPILKLQNELILALFKSYLAKRKGTFFKLSLDGKMAYIETSLKKDLRFKQYMIGVVVGHFTVEEYEIFIKNEAELSRRITTMLIQRIQDQCNNIKPPQ